MNHNDNNNDKDNNHKGSILSSLKYYSRQGLLWAILASLLFHCVGFLTAEWGGWRVNPLNAIALTPDPLATLVIEPYVSQPPIKKPDNLQETPPVIAKIDKIDKVDNKVKPKMIKPKPVIKAVPVKPIFINPDIDNIDNLDDTVINVKKETLKPDDVINTNDISNQVKPIDTPKNIDISPTIQEPPNTLPPFNHSQITYQLPQSLTVHYDTLKEGADIITDTVLTFKYTLNNNNKNNNKNNNIINDINHTNQKVEDAQIFMYRPISSEPFPTYEITLNNTALDFKHLAIGNLTQYGVRLLRAEEKRSNASMIATTVEPDLSRAVVSSVEGFIPYNPNTLDGLSVLLQLAISSQINSQWPTSGVTYDINVYRPTGVIVWRFQSIGFQTINIGDKSVETLHVKRANLDNQINYDDDYHLWLDPKRNGFPIKMQWVNHRGNTTEFIMKSWEENKE